MAEEKLVTVTLPHVSGFAEDSVVNTFAVRTAGTWNPGTDLLDVSGPISGFYNHVGGGALCVADYLSQGLSRAALAATIRVYDVEDHLDGSPHGSPIAEDHFTLDAPPNYPAMPEETSLALTLRADDWELQPVEEPDDADGDLVAQRPRQRYTGKLYVGPFNTQAATEDGSKRARPVTDLRTTMLDAAEWTFDQLAANDHWWSVWSRKEATFRTLSQVQVDDAWDTQRRRGVDPTVRTTRTVMP